MGTLLVVMILLLASGLAVRKISIDKKKGKSMSCGGNCAGCLGRCSGESSSDRDSKNLRE